MLFVVSCWLLAICYSRLLPAPPLPTSPSPHTPHTPLLHENLRISLLRSPLVQEISWDKKVKKS